MRLLVVVAGVFGASGVTAAAAAAHGGGPNLDTAALFLMIHAAALTGVASIAGSGREGAGLAGFAGGLMALGVVLFAGDLLVRDLAGGAVLPMVAPVGGSTIIAGWLLLAAAGFTRRRPAARRDAETE